jgi:hypothetical protein
LKSRFSPIISEKGKDLIPETLLLSAEKIYLTLWLLSYCDVVQLYPETGPYGQELKEV